MEKITFNYTTTEFNSKLKNCFDYFETNGETFRGKLCSLEYEFHFYKHLKKMFPNFKLLL